MLVFAGTRTAVSGDWWSTSNADIYCSPNYPAEDGFGLSGRAVIPSPLDPVGLFRGHAIEGGVTMGLDHDLDRILDPLAGIFQRGRQILQREGVRMHLGRVKTLLRHERLGAMRRALAFAADAIDVEVFTHDICDLWVGGFGRECRQTDAAAAVDHARGFVDRLRRAGALNDVVDALATVQLAHGSDRVFVFGVDDVVGAEFAPDLKAVVARAGQDHR